MSASVLASHGAEAGDVIRTMTTREIKGGMELSFGVIQDCDDLIRRCTAARNADTLRGHAKPRAFRLVAELPLALVEVLAARGIDILNNKKELRKLLNDPAFRAFRTTQGRL